MFDYGELDDAESSELTARVQVEACAAPAPLRSFEIDTTGVWVEVFAEGDQQTFPSEFVEADYVARGAAGCTFDCSAGKGQGPMRMELGHGAIVPGMELALKALSLGAVAQVRIPAALGYGSLGVPNLVPPNCDLYYELRICVVDGKAQPDATKVSGGCGNSPPHKLVKEVAGGGMVLVHPWWLARVERPPPTSYYLSFCQRLELGIPVGVLHRARPIVRKSCREMSGWDLTGSAVIVRGVQDTWKARREWDLEWFQKKLGQRRQLVKWQGPVFTKQERLWEQPIWETSLAEYLDYVQALERADPNCSRVNAEGCPRLYLNGWPAFLQVPWLREYIVNPAFIDDCSGDLIAGNEELRENFIAALTRGYEPPTEAERQKAIDDEYWELSKLFISPKGAITRLHFDNGGAHAWLSQVRGRKLFVCFPPSDGPHLHPFEGDEGLLNGSWLDPLDPDVLQRWPDYARATPYVAVVEEGETLFAPQGWWHYAVALDTSVTVMRNFYSKKNRQEHIQRKDEALADAIGIHVLRRQKALQAQPDSVLKEIARRTVGKIREALEAAQASAAQVRRPHPGGAAAACGGGGTAGGRAA